MYSGTTFRHASGNILGAHQKIDRVACRALRSALPACSFPRIKDILHFEGKNGPDGVKRKSPAQDEPWHYYDPAGTQNQPLLDIIADHSQNLTAALRQNNMQKAAFEAAWLAHAIVDGLTPAHHFPLQAELERLRGEGIETRTNLKEKLLIRQPGDTRGQTLSKNWQFWGAKGIMTTHVLFEIGVATTIKPLALKNGYPSAEDVKRVQKEGFAAVFMEAARDIQSLGLYEKFQKFGWTRQLARMTRQQLAPLIVKVVVLGWYAAACQAADGTHPKAGKAQQTGATP